MARQAGRVCCEVEWFGGGISLAELHLLGYVVVSEDFPSSVGVTAFWNSVFLCEIDISVFM